MIPPIPVILVSSIVAATVGCSFFSAAAFEGDEQQSSRILSSPYYAKDFLLGNYEDLGSQWETEAFYEDGDIEKDPIIKSMDKYGQVQTANLFIKVLSSLPKDIFFGAKGKEWMNGFDGKGDPAVGIFEINVKNTGSITDEKMHDQIYVPFDIDAMQGHGIVVDPLEEMLGCLEWHWDKVVFCDSSGQEKELAIILHQDSKKPISNSGTRINTSIIAKTIKEEKEKIKELLKNSSPSPSTSEIKTKQAENEKKQKIYKIVLYMTKLHNMVFKIMDQKFLVTKQDHIKPQYIKHFELGGRQGKKRGLLWKWTYKKINKK